MVTLNTALLVGLIASIISVIGALTLVVLGKIYLNTRPKSEEDEGGNGYTLLPIGGMGGRTITQADIDQARAAIAKAGGGGAPGAPAAPEAEVRETGGYI